MSWIATCNLLTQFQWLFFFVWNFVATHDASCKLQQNQYRSKSLERAHSKSLNSSMVLLVIYIWERETESYIRTKSTCKQIEDDDRASGLALSCKLRDLLWVQVCSVWHAIGWPSHVISSSLPTKLNSTTKTVHLHFNFNPNNSNNNNNNNKKPVNSQPKSMRRKWNESGASKKRKRRSGFARKQQR